MTCETAEQMRSAAEALAMARLELDAARAKFVGRADPKTGAALAQAKREYHKAHKAIFSVVK
jgi:hypothetical protein